MDLTGQSFIGFRRTTGSAHSFRAFSTAANAELEPAFAIAAPAELMQAAELAQAAFFSYSNMPPDRRAAFLDLIAEKIMSLGDTLIERSVAESGLPAARLIGERARTCGQLKMFANLLREGWWVDARIDTAQPERQPQPRPDIRRMLVPIGPVAVFGASNFPLAFSTAGGDTASALAAGCPVVVKAHSSHPGTNELVSSAIIAAAKESGMPDGVFSSLYLSHEDAARLVKHPLIKAVGFTGSRKVGMILFNAAVTRPDPIPVYAEMSAINPVFLFDHALQTEGEKIARGLAASVTLGVGQFCTNPGLVITMKSEATERLIRDFAKEITTVAPASMLDQNIWKAYCKSTGALATQNGVQEIARAATEPADEYSQGRAMAFRVDAAGFLTNPLLSEEVFGPATLFVLCNNITQMAEVAAALEGQLTVTVHASADDGPLLAPLIQTITGKAGRIIFGGFPTGVEVCHAMQHGGPFPSTTDPRSTSVGTGAIYRFARPLAFQDCPDHLLPDALKNSNPLQIVRLKNGEWSDQPV